MIQDQSGIGIPDFAGEVGVEGQRAGVVDDRDFQLQSLFSDRGLVGVDRDRHSELAFESLQHRDQAAQLFGLEHAHGTGLSGFGAHVDDVRALLLELDRAGEGAIGVQEFSAVGE